MINHEIDIAGAARARIYGTTASRAQNAESLQHYCDVLAQAYILLVEHISGQFCRPLMSLQITRRNQAAGQPFLRPVFAMLRLTPL
jgi:hypothetical protein